MIRLHRAASGDYRFGDFGIQRGWSSEPGTDRRRELWTVYVLEHHPDGQVADLLTDWPTLREARAEVERLAQERTAAT